MEKIGSTNKQTTIGIMIFITRKEDFTDNTYMQKTCDVAEKAIVAKKKLRKKCVNRDKM